MPAPDALTPESLDRYGDDDLLSWLTHRDLTVQYGPGGVLIGVADRASFATPLIFRASGRTLRAAVRDLLAREQGSIL